MSPRPIYLDNCATTRVDPEVLTAMIRAFDFDYGNAASNSHEYGWTAQTAVESAAEEIANLIGATPRELVFTSGATESNNLAITGFAATQTGSARHWITCRTEHKSVLDTCQALEQQGWEITYLDVDPQGQISLDELRRAIRPGETRMLSLMWVNNETGVIQPLDAIREICQSHQVRLHVDATQAVGKIPVNVRTKGIDLLSFSAHKMHGPKGIGCLYVRRDGKLRLQPILHGGRHQGGMRSGTLPVPLIVGMGVAARLAGQRLESESLRLADLRDRLESQLCQRLPGTVVHGAGAPRSSIVTSLGFPEVDGESLLVRLDRIAASAGSACTSASGQPSYVLQAMGVAPELAAASLRLSLSRFTTEEEIEFAIDYLVEVVSELQMGSKLAGGRFA